MMPLGERIKLLRKEKGWGQGELAELVGADARQISRYETGKIKPSIDAIVKIAKAFDVSVDYLLVDDAPRRPLSVADPDLAKHLYDIQSLSEQDKASLLHILEALLAKNKVKSLARELG